MTNELPSNLHEYKLLCEVIIHLYYRNYLVELSNLFFLRYAYTELNNNKIEIPNIPQIPKIEKVFAQESSNWWTQVLDFFVSFANGFFTFINAVINVLNFFVQTINIIIQLLQFIFILLRNIFTLRDNLVSQPLPV